MVTTPKLNLDTAMRYLLTEVSRHIARATGRINHIFGGRYRWSWLSHPISLAYVYKYIYRNPVRVGISERAEHYPFSSLYRLLHKCDDFPLTEGTDWLFIPKATEERLRWLNEPTPKEYEDLVRLALRRRTFAFSKDKKMQLRMRRLEQNYFPQ